MFVYGRLLNHHNRSRKSIRAWKTWWPTRVLKGRWSKISGLEEEYAKSDNGFGFAVQKYVYRCRIVMIQFCQIRNSFLLNCNFQFFIRHLVNFCRNSHLMGLENFSDHFFRNFHFVRAVWNILMRLFYTGDISGTANLTVSKFLRFNDRVLSKVQSKFLTPENHQFFSLWAQIKKVWIKRFWLNLRTQIWLGYFTLCQSAY